MQVDTIITVSKALHDAGVRFIENPFDFDAEYAAADRFELVADVPWRVLRVDALIAMKLAAGRPVDLDDVEHLKALKTLRS